MRHHLLGLLLLLSAACAWASPALDLVVAARSQVGVTRRYDPSYQRIGYPGGDVPLDRGVCTDVVVRAYRKLGIDLQDRVHRDMKQAWAAYPHPAKWGLSKPDTNIDHRRVPNLAVYFGRHGKTLAPSTNARDYQPGDIVVWMLPMSLPHIGIVSDQVSRWGTPLVIHNIGAGTQEDDLLFAFAITGHYRFP
jgi:uncharacterized protein YijF (DUF1287 family)